MIIGGEAMATIGDLTQAEVKFCEIILTQGA